MDGRGNDQQELSLTIKYLLENPALLQPPDTNNSGKKIIITSFYYIRYLSFFFIV